MSDKGKKRATSSAYVTTNKNSLSRLKRKLDSIDTEFKNSRGRQVIKVVISANKQRKKAT